MSSRLGFMFAGALVGAVLDLLVNLVAAAIQQHAFANQLSTTAFIGLVVAILFFALLGAWLGKKIEVPALASTITPKSSSGTGVAATQPSTTNPLTSTSPPGTIAITRFKALFSYYRLKGHGIHLSDILSFGSVVHIDSTDQETP